MGIPDHLTCLLRNLYAGQEATVRTGDGTTDWFQIGHRATMAKMDDAIAYVNNAQNQIERLEKDIKSLQDGFKAALNDNNKLKSDTTSAFTMINEIQKKCDKAQNELANIATVMKSKDEVDEGQDVPDKSGDAGGQSAEPADDGKSKGKKVSRKDKNAKIIEAIEKKAKKNQNTK